jgi:hypothetical protein
VPVTVFPGRSKDADREFAEVQRPQKEKVERNRATIEGRLPEKP